jgi:eight-cysteine-cluster-containing protein
MRYALLILLLACGSKSNSPSEPSNQSPAACIKTGCSGTVCAEPGKEVMTTCEYKPEYGCYKDGVCERQGNGACGWTQTPALQACLANPPPIEPGGAPM